MCLLLIGEFPFIRIIFLKKLKLKIFGKINSEHFNTYIFVCKAETLYILMGILRLTQY